MTEQEKQDILRKAKTFFQEKILPNHIKNTEKCESLTAFNINPFLHRYISRFAFGDESAESLAKALIYPRVLGTSITTSFGSIMQGFCNDVLSSYASTTAGMDIEFIDITDGRRKYCQLKAGPNTINRGDVRPIKDDFRGVQNLARTNRLRITSDDLVLCVLYGTHDELNGFYREVERDYPVYVGEEFWYRLTGIHGFYDEFVQAMNDGIREIDESGLLQSTITALAEQIRQREEEA